MAPPKKTVARAARPTPPAADPLDAAAPRLARLKELVKILEASTLAELSYEDEDIAVTIRRAKESDGAGALATAHARPAPTHVSRGVEPAAAPAEDASLHIVRSPFVGTFYRAASPDASAYTDVGQQVRRGQTVCIVEAMKLMNEIESEVEGTVVEVVVRNGSSVQYGDALFRIRTA